MAVSTESLGDRRFALLLAVSQYADPMLSRLRSPAADAVALRDLLADPEVGGFAVTSVFDEKAQAMRLAVEEFLTDRRPDDVVLVYLSCHGLVDVRRRLYFAARDTLKNRLAASGVEAHWLLEQLEDCRARRQVVVLDCCFSGAFAQGAKGDTDLALGERLMGQGRGRVVLTASRGTEYSFEGEPTEGRHHQGRSSPAPWSAGSRAARRMPTTTGTSRWTRPTPTRSRRSEKPEGNRLRNDGCTAQRARSCLPGSPSRSARRPRRHRYHDRNLRKNGSNRFRPRCTPPSPLRSHVDGDRGCSARQPRRCSCWPVHWVPACSTAETVAAAPTMGGSGTLGPHQFAVEAPWRLVVRGEDVGDGCTVTVTDEAGQTQTAEDVYATEYFQMHSSGTVEWEANHPDCRVFQQPTANEQQLPFVWRISQGDTPAFSASGAVTVDVLNFHGNDSCDLDLHAVEDGREVSFGTVATKAKPAVLDTYGASPVYIADADCSFRITAGGWPAGPSPRQRSTSPPRCHANTGVKFPA